jgi:hypothetical protein
VPSFESGFADIKFIKGNWPKQQTALEKTACEMDHAREDNI